MCEKISFKLLACKYTGGLCKIFLGFYSSCILVKNIIVKLMVILISCLKSTSLNRFISVNRNSKC